MLRIMLPCRACNEDDLKARIGILRSCVGEKYSIGLELVGPWNDFFDNDIIKKTKNNLVKFQEHNDIFLSLHAPLNKKDLGKNLFNPGEKQANNLRHIIKVAKEVGAFLVNVHGSSILSYQEMLREKRGIEALVSAQIDRVAKILGEVSFSGTLCVENITGYWGMNKLDVKNLSDFEEANYEIAFVNTEDFLLLHEKQERAFATIDICHLSAVYDSSELLNQLRKVGPILRHVHLSDSRSTWHQFLPRFEEGLIPGDGKIGERVFREDILPYLVELSKERDINIMLEVLDKDFIASEESIKALKRLMVWLVEIDK